MNNPLVQQAVNFLTPLLAGISSKFAVYRGSATSPPCQRTVNWMISDSVQKIRRSQIHQLQSLEDEKGEKILESFRELQKRNF